MQNWRESAVIKYSSPMDLQGSQMSRKGKIFYSLAKIKVGEEEEKFYCYNFNPFSSLRGILFCNKKYFLCFCYRKM